MSVIYLQMNKSIFILRSVTHLMLVVCIHKSTHCAQSMFRFSVIQDMRILSSKIKGNSTSLWSYPVTFYLLLRITFIWTVLSSFYNYSNQKNPHHTPRVIFLTSNITMTLEGYNLPINVFEKVYRHKFYS